jgi:hypothetical protein
MWRKLDAFLLIWEKTIQRLIQVRITLDKHEVNNLIVMQLTKNNFYKLHKLLNSRTTMYMYYERLTREKAQNIHFKRSIFYHSQCSPHQLKKGRPAPLPTEKAVSTPLKGAPLLKKLKNYVFFRK